MSNRTEHTDRTAPMAALLIVALAASPANRRRADRILKCSTVFKWLTPDDKLAAYGLDDPEVNGSVCHFPVPKRGDLKGWIGVAEEASAIRSLGADPTVTRAMPSPALMTA
jgi:CreA protein